MDKLLTVDEVAGLLAVQKSTIYAWVNQGYIPYCKIGKFVRFRQKRIESWIEGKETTGRKQMISVDNCLQTAYSVEQTKRR